MFGSVLSFAAGLAAWRRSIARAGGYYESEIYGMSPAAHRRYAMAFAALVAAQAALLVRGGIGTALSALGYGLVTASVLGAILYGATFLRGAAGEDE